MLQLVSATCSHATLFRGCWACDLSQLHALNWRKQWSTRKLYAFFFLKSHVKKSGRSTDCYCRSLIICDSIWLFSIFSSIPPKKSWISRKLNILQKIRALLFLENLFRQVRVVFFFSISNFFSWGMKNIIHPVVLILVCSLTMEEDAVGRAAERGRTRW